MIVHYMGRNFQIGMYIKSLKIGFILANSEGPEDMSCVAAFHL